MDDSAGKMDREEPAPIPLRHAATKEQQWLAAIVASSDDAIIGESLDGLVTSWNKGAEQIFGYTAAEIVGQPITLLGWPGNEEDMARLVARVCRRERVDHYQTTRRHRNGQQLHISLSLSPILDPSGAIVGVSKIARDMTEQIRFQHAMQENARQLELARAEVAAQGRFRDLIENAPDAILQVDAHGIILLANRAAEAMLGYSRTELVGHGVDTLVPNSIRPHHAALRNSYLEAPRVRPMASGLDLRARRKDGVELPVEISLSPNPTDTGTSVTVVIRDVSERHQAEEQIRALQAGYLRELETRQQEAERSNRIKSEFLASMSHELRTPLHTILGFTELLAEESAGQLNDKQRRFLGHIQRDSTHLLELINDVLDLSSIEAGSMVLKLAPLGLNPLIADVVAAIQPQAQVKGLQLEDRTSPLPAVVGDAVRIKEVLYNLLGNAVKFTPAQGRVWVEAATWQDGFVSITVVDTGIGIALQEQANIFDKFYQVGQTTSGVREGTGLGLAISRRLVEMQGGRIRVDSTPGCGSRFHFTIPIA